MPCEAANAQKIVGLRSPRWNVREPLKTNCLISGTGWTISANSNSQIAFDLAAVAEFKRWPPSALIHSCRQFLPLHWLNFGIE
jgi:hypothetical protein